VALIEEQRVLLSAEHETPNAHAEELLPLIGRLMAEAGWAKTSLDRVAVGVGPGSFTGLRVGIALAHGIGIGLDIPVVGVGSLAAMAAAVSIEDPRARCTLLDARRAEIFYALYAPDGTELSAPQTLPRAGFASHLAEWCGHRTCVVLGEVLAELSLETDVLRSPGTDLPHAIWTARIGAALPAETPSEPLYVRDAGAVRPNLPPSPFHS
jgi:tRNA threonylcarbamoyladenosine biosynthesis protein TsaB